MGPDHQGLLSGRGARPGYALLTVVMGLAAVSVFVAMAVAPNVAQLRDQWRVDHTLDRLTWLTDGETAIVRFHADLDTYPGRLSHLSTAITGDDTDLCTTGYSATAVDDWAGRYAGRLYEQGGTPVAIGMMQDELHYDDSTTPPVMVVVVEGVREEQARRLDRKEDGVQDAAAGRVRYTAADATGLVTLRWRTEVDACP